MKLVIAGASGFVGTELIRQSLALPQITSVIALARRPVSAPENLGSGDASKLHSAVVKDYDEYPDEVKKQLAGADACIWTVAITPTKSRAMEFEKVRRVCHDYTLVGLKTMSEVRGEATTPFRFIYMSGTAAERDQTKTPRFMPQYSLMRGETENDVLSFAAQHKDKIEACVAKPGLITAPGNLARTAFATIMHWTGIVPTLSVGEVVAAMLDQTQNGFEKEPLQHDDLVRIGRASLQSEGSGKK